MANQYTLKNGGYEPFIGNYGLVPQPPIPEPDAEDNGKVLGVADGAYALVSGGGGGGASGMVVEMLINESNVPYINCPANELYEALSNGTNVVVISNTTSPSQINQLVGASMQEIEEETIRYSFELVMANPNGTVQGGVFGGNNTDMPTLVDVGN